MEDAMLAIVPAILSALLTGFVSWVIFKRQLRVEHVTDRRMEWITLWRNEMAIFLSYAEILHQDPAAATPENLQKMAQSKYAIFMRVNINEPMHLQMLQMLKEFDYAASDSVFVKQKELIEELTREILKPEWERVKNESAL